MDDCWKCARCGRDVPPPPIPAAAPPVELVLSLALVLLCLVIETRAPRVVIF